MNLKTIADHLPALIAYVDADERYRYANATYEKWYQLPLSDIVNRPVKDVLGPQRYALIEPYVRRALAGEQISYQVQYPHPDGYTREVQVRYIPDTDGGTVHGFYALINDITENASTAAHLRESMARLNEAQRIAKVGSWELDLLSSKLSWSDEIFRMFEIDKDKFGASYEAFLDAIHPDDRDFVNQAYTDSLKTRLPYEVTHRLRMEDGRTKWVNERCESFFDESGRALRSIGTVQDVTERVNAESKLRETSQLLDSIVENMPNMVFLKRADDLRFALFNRAGEQLIGVSSEQLLGKNDYEFFPKEQADFFVAKDRAVLAQREVVDIPEEPIDTRTKGRRILHTKKISLRDEHGLPRYLLGISEDITERKQAERELRRLNETLEQRVAERTAELDAERNFIDTVLDTAGALVVVMDRRGFVVKFNRACELITGFTFEELHDKPIWEYVIPPEQREGVQRVFANLRDTALPSNYDNEWLKRDGGRRLIAWSNSTLKDEAGEVTFVIATGIDITEREQARQALLAAKQEAERANAAKTEFLSRMSHELRTPMNAILGFGQLLEGSTKPPLAAQEAGYVKEILLAGKHLLELINEVLDLARVESGHMRLNIAPLDVAQTIAASVALLQPLAAERGIAFGTRAVPRSAASVMGDPVRLSQVLVNLLSNAVKFNRPGGNIGIDCAEDGGEWVRLTITDSGSGITPEQQGRLFMPFERLDADKRGIEGTGIGLAISKRFVELMGGEIGVDSTPDVGSSFWVRLRRG